MSDYEYRGAQCITCGDEQILSGWSERWNCSINVACPECAGGDWDEAIPAMERLCAARLRQTRARLQATADPVLSDTFALADVA